MTAATTKTRAPWLLLAFALAFTATTGCNDNDSVTGGGGVLILVTCDVSNPTVGAGSAQGVLVGARVTRDGVAAPGVTVVFTSNIGDVAPDAVVTGADGRATAVFLPPGAGGIALITATVNDVVGGFASATCTVIVTGSTSPRLSVTVLSPATLAGLTVNVRFNAAFLSLAAGGAQALGPLASAGCVTSSNEVGAGVLRLIEACTTERAVGGALVAQFTFDNIGPVQTAADFAVTCEGVDAASNFVATACGTQVTQL